ncbi:hypothetical protein ABW286_16765 [Erwinia papayae]|uniref:Uncharacterized protein n=1 Tax=Erwinia papayae TaxID=206499 RepID=A0ABV3N4Y2_9GAMM
MMYEQVTLSQGKDWILIVYYLLSVLLFIIFYACKFVRQFKVRVNKLIVFIILLPFIVLQFSVLMYGLDWIYLAFGMVSQDGRILRSSALFFSISYLAFIPLREDKINQAVNNNEE